MRSGLSMGEEIKCTTRDSENKGTSTKRRIIRKKNFTKKEKKNEFNEKRISYTEKIA